MISLLFRNNRSNGEQFVILISKQKAQQKDDFVRASEHGITKAELKKGDVILSTDSGEISFKDMTVYHNNRLILATQFDIRPTQTTLDKISQTENFELIINDTEHIAFVDITVK